MKIIGISASPRKSQSRTAQLVDALLEQVRSTGAEIEHIDLGRQKINYCLGCGQCHKLGHCVQKEVKELTDKLLAADGFVLASPVYIYQVTAQLKTFIDHLGHFIHCQRFSGKYGAVIATSGGSGEVETIDFMEWLLKRTGAMCVGKKGFTIPHEGLLAEDDPIFHEIRNLGDELVSSIKEKKIFAGQLKEQEDIRGYFRDVIMWRKEQWSWEYRYWQEKGWL